MKKLLIILLLFTVTAAHAQKKRKTTTTTTTTVVTEPAPLVYWPVVNSYVLDWDVQVDTSICGFVIFKWAQQPFFTTQKDSQYALIGRYYLYARPLTYNFDYPCGGMFSYTNSYYYTLNSGCSFTGNQTYEMSIRYYYKDVANEQIICYSSKVITVTTGRNQWECPK